MRRLQPPSCTLAPPLPPPRVADTCVWTGCCPMSHRGVDEASSGAACHPGPQLFWILRIKGVTSTGGIANLETLWNVFSLFLLVKRGMARGMTRRVRQIVFITLYGNS